MWSCFVDVGSGDLHTQQLPASNESGKTRANRFDWMPKLLGGFVANQVCENYQWNLGCGASILEFESGKRKGVPVNILSRFSEMRASR
jgi:hypothetical protein